MELKKLHLTQERKKEAEKMNKMFSEMFPH